MVKLNHYSINDDKNTYSQTNKIIENFGLKKPVEFFDNSNSKTPITDNNIHDAVNEWVTNPTQGTTKYGHIKDWDTSAVTDMSNLFKDKTAFTFDTFQPLKSPLNAVLSLNI